MLCLHWEWGWKFSGAGGKIREGLDPFALLCLHGEGPGGGWEMGGGSSGVGMYDKGRLDRPFSFACMGFGKGGAGGASSGVV